MTDARTPGQEVEKIRRYVAEWQASGWDNDQYAMTGAEALFLLAHITTLERAVAEAKEDADELYRALTVEVEAVDAARRALAEKEA